MKPNPDIALIYHYDLARALAGEVVDWVAIPVNVQAGREGGDLCRLAADFGKRRDLFAMPAPTKNAAPTSVPAGVVEQCAADPQPETASSPVAVSAAEPDKLRARVKQLVARHPLADRLLRQYWPEGVPTLKHSGQTDEQLAWILQCIQQVESEVGAGWHPDDSPDPRSAKAIRRALDAWADRDPGTAWFAASLIATFEQCRNADATFEDLVASFTIEQCDRLHDAAQGQP